MILYRLADTKYVEDLEGMGAKLFGGRWNEVNTACIYTSEHLSLAFLEKYVHAKAKENMLNMALMTIEIPIEKDLITRVDEHKLAKNWMDDPSYTQWLGSQILQDSSVLAFSVPSVLIPSERNYVLNPQSIHFKQLRFKNVNFKTDYRFLNMLC